jgi:hypothetical protein
LLFFTIYLVAGWNIVQVAQLNRSLDEKDNELAALEASLDILAPVDANGDRNFNGSLSAADEQRLESLQAWLSSGSSKQGARIKYDSHSLALL